MKILFISPRYSGGIGGHASTLAQKLTEYGFEVKLMHVPHIPIKNLKNPSFAFFGIIKGLTARKHFDIVHAFNIPSVFAMKYAKGKKKVLSVHGVFGEQVNVTHSSGVSYIANMTESKVLKWPDALTTDSKAAKNEYQEKLNIDFIYLPSPIDTSKFKKIPTVDHIENQVAYVGRDSFEKGIDVLRKAEPNIKGKVVYCTNLPWEEAMKILKSSRVLVVPSRMESLPTTIKEAFFLKIPVIATNVGGIPELVINNETGILVPPNDPSKLADAINLLLENKEKSNELANQGFNFVIKNMTWDVVLPKYVKFYENLLKN